MSFYDEHVKPAIGADDQPLVATPGDVLAYRTAWDDYVMGTLRAIMATADSFDAVSANPPAGFTAAELTAMGKSYRDVANAQLALWNQFAGEAPENIVFQSRMILNAYQDLVKRVATFRESANMKQFYSGKLPDPPTLDVQRSIIARLQGLSLVANGALNLFTGSVSNGLQIIGGKAGEVVAAGVKGAGAAAKPALGAIWDVIPWWGWAVIGLGGIAASVTAVKALPLLVPGAGLLLPHHRD